MERAERALEFLEALHPLLIYAVLGLGSALENLFPPIPADTFVVVGGFLAARGEAGVWWVWAVTFACNVSSALLVYWMGHRFGRTFFETGLGRFVLTEGQLRRMARFYARFGVSAIFFTRFLPGLRAVVPAFAGVSHQRFWPVAIPLAGASALWHAALVWLGAAAGQNLERVLGWVERGNVVLLLVALLVAVPIVAWWVRTRRTPRA